MGIPSSTEKKYQKLKNIIGEMSSVLVAFSGGVDSTFLAKTAFDVLGSRFMAVIATSETYPQKEIDQAVQLARDLGLPFKLIETNELEHSEFIKNPADRCYHCKKELFSNLTHIAGEKGLAYVLDGANADDLSDYRPGAKAGRELGVRSPLQEVGLNKEEIRLLSHKIGLPTWNKPSLACLASRFPYEHPIDREGLLRVGKAEDFLLSLGFRQVRVRHHGETARIEVGEKELNRFLNNEIRINVCSQLKVLGFVYITLDLQGYRSGSMNEALKKPTPKKE